MSDRYSTSPGLRLKVEASRIRRALYGLFVVCIGMALVLLCCAGYGLPSCVIGLWCGRWLWQLRFDQALGDSLCWQAGVWYLESAAQGRRSAIEIMQAHAPVSWIVHLSLRECPAGRRRHLWLFPDSAASNELRLLRVRVALEASNDYR